MIVHILHQGVTLCGFPWYLHEPGDRWVAQRDAASMRKRPSACPHCVKAYADKVASDAKKGDE